MRTMLCSYTSTAKGTCISYISMHHIAKMAVLIIFIRRMFFSKRKPHSGERTHDNIKLTEVVITQNWKSIIDQFAKNESLSTVGIGASCSGFQYHNFYWARGSYIRLLVSPTLTKNRYYYERWLGMLDSTKEGGGNDTVPRRIFESMAEGTKGVSPEHIGVPVNVPNHISLCTNDPVSTLDTCFERFFPLDNCIRNRFRNQSSIF